jgi:hypothetical protein
LTAILAAATADRPKKQQGDDQHSLGHSADRTNASPLYQFRLQPDYQSRIATALTPPVDVVLVFARTQG